MRPFPPIFVQITAFAVALAIALVLSPRLAQAQADALMVSVITEANPCRHVQHGDVPMDTLDFVRLDGFNITREGLIVSASAQGSLGCTQPGVDGAVEAQAAMDFGASLTLDLADCSVALSMVDLGNYRGPQAVALQAASDVHVAAFLAAMQQRVVSECRTFLGRAG